MNREGFMAELERLLSGMPDDERNAAVQYYADYFADAGAENEDAVIRELGSPEKVAESIKADYYGTQFHAEDFEHKDYMEKYGSGPERREESSWKGNRESGGPRTDNRLKVVLLILIAVVLWPVTLGIGAAVIGVAAAAVSVCAALVVAAVCIMFAGVIVIVVGLALIAIPPSAFIVMGIGILLFVFGLIATAGTVKLCIVVYPAMLRGFVNLCRRPFYGKAV